jgi:hypothetical protein
MQVSFGNRHFLGARGAHGGGSGAAREAPAARSDPGAVHIQTELFHCLIRYKEAAMTSLIVKRAIKVRGDAGWTGWETSTPTPALTVECNERLERFTPEP